MCEELIIRHCAPTLAGMKTGTIFNCTYDTDEGLRAWLSGINRRLSHKGIRAVPLKKQNNRALIYIYRPTKLKKDISSTEASRLLCHYGYADAVPSKCVVKLIERLKQSEDFPHEIGLFLGYPVDDVKGFIEHGAKASKCVGCWRVYGNEEQAKKTFSKYKRCTDTYLRQFKNGNTLLRLTVAV